ncbi:hypothetical protein D3C75_1068880 [compost metagenome]
MKSDEIENPSKAIVVESILNKVTFPVPYLCNNLLANKLDITVQNETINDI